MDNQKYVIRVRDNDGPFFTGFVTKRRVLTLDVTILKKHAKVYEDKESAEADVQKIFNLENGQYRAVIINFDEAPDNIGLHHAIGRMKK